MADFVGVAADQFITLILPQPGQARPAVERGELNWEAFRQIPDAIRPHARNYTVRAHRPDLAEVDVDFVVHGDEGAASAWALRAQPGDQLAVWGPRMAYEPPADCWQLLIGDETGLPAIGAILAALPAGARALALVEVADAAEQQALPSAGAVEVRWFFRDGVASGESDLLLDATRALTFPPGAIYIWGGGERRVMSAIKKHLHDERGIGSDAVSILNYWRRGEGH
jgi:NADPH-dependent ferric siderophore reductase